jgi:hypothetical protein
LPTQNEWSWTNLSSVLYVEQPVGTGYSQGKPTARVWFLSTGVYVMFTVRLMPERGRRCGTARRILAAVFGNFLRTERKEILSHWRKCEYMSSTVTETHLTILWQYAGMFVPCESYP